MLVLIILIVELIKSETTPERYVLLDHLYSIIEDDPNLSIQQAPPRLSLIFWGIFNN